MWLILAQHLLHGKLYPTRLQPLNFPQNPLKLINNPHIPPILSTPTNQKLPPLILLPGSMYIINLKYWILSLGLPSITRLLRIIIIVKHDTKCVSNWEILGVCSLVWWFVVVVTGEGFEHFSAHVCCVHWYYFLLYMDFFLYYYMYVNVIFLTMDLYGIFHIAAYIKWNF